MGLVPYFCGVWFLNVWNQQPARTRCEAVCQRLAELKLCAVKSLGLLTGSDGMPGGALRAPTALPKNNSGGLWL